MLLLVAVAAAVYLAVIFFVVTLSAGLGCQAKITSVIGVTEDNLYDRIVIEGSCFGSNPTYVPVSSFAPYNGTDTQNCGAGLAPPTMSISEWGSNSGSGDWSAGRFISSNDGCPWGDSIGLTYTSWTPTMIVIGHGFGNALGTATQNIGAPWQMNPDSQCAVILHNPANTDTPANFTLPSGSC
ncbi:MAG: hypothetical protein WCB18_05990 [Thermoplasmata archaeon]